MNLFIGGSANEKIDDIYFNDCCSLLEKIARIDNINLVFGSYNKGLMGCCYKEFYKNNKNILGILTKNHKSIQDNFPISREIIVDGSTERFLNIYKNSDVLLFLPGGLGTLAELFSAIEENRENTNKLIIIYNDNYFYTPIIKELYQMYQDKFIDSVPYEYMVIENDIDKIIKLIKKEI